LNIYHTRGISFIRVDWPNVPLIFPKW